MHLPQLVLILSLTHVTPEYARYLIVNVLVNGAWKSGYRCLYIFPGKGRSSV